MSDRGERRPTSESEGDLRLEGRTAVVTGSSRGIGKAIALRLAREGADVVVNALRKKTAGEAVVAEIESMGRRSHLVKANVGDRGHLTRLFEEAEAQLGSVDIFVSNAASGVLKPALEIGPKEWNWTMSINAQALLWGSQMASSGMEERGWGRIVGLTSLGSIRAFPEYSIVGVSKAAIEAITRYLAVELAPSGITVNAVSPGVVETDALDYFPSRDQIVPISKEHTPAGRLASPEDVAGLVAFLCSDDAAMITGQTIHVDGGYSITAW